MPSAPSHPYRLCNVTLHVEPILENWSWPKKVLVLAQLESRCRRAWRVPQLRLCSRWHCRCVGKGDAGRPNPINRSAGVWLYELSTLGDAWKGNQPPSSHRCGPARAFPGSQATHDRRRCRLLPRIRAGSDQLDNLVDTLSHDDLLSCPGTPGREPGGLDGTGDPGTGSWVMGRGLGATPASLMLQEVLLASQREPMRPRYP